MSCRVVVGVITSVGQGQEHLVRASRILQLKITVFGILLLSCKELAQQLLLIVSMISRSTTHFTQEFINKICMSLLLIHLNREFIKYSKNN